jgi:hypothetical protein
MKENIFNKMFWYSLISVITTFLLLIGLIGISIVSFFQTNKTFEPLNDPSIIIFTLPFGMWISLFMSFIVQYGQNVALIVIALFCKNIVIFQIGKIKITDTNIAWIIFWITAITDAATNIVWFMTTVEIPDDIITGTIVRLIGYGTMILSIFSEEALGIVLDSFSKSLEQLKKIVNGDFSSDGDKRNQAQKNNLSSPNNNSSYKQTETPFGISRPSYTPAMKENDAYSTQNKPSNPTYGNSSQFSSSKPKLTPAEEARKKYDEMNRQKRIEENRNGNG